MARSEQSCPLRVCLIADQPGEQVLIRERLARFDVEIYATPRLLDEDGIAYDCECDVILVCRELNGPGLLSILERARTNHRSVPVVVLNDGMHPQLALEAVRAGAEDVLSRYELDDSQLYRSLLFACERNRLERELLDETWQEADARAEQVEREKRYLEREREGLIQQELQLNTILGETTDFVAAVSLDLSARYINPAGLELLGFDREERVFGLSMMDLHPPAERVRMEREIIPLLLEEGRWTGTIELLSRGGDLILCDAVISLHHTAEGVPSFYSTIARDITERSAIEEQLREAQKIEAVGRLAGGIAHDFNNLLTAISSFGRFAIETVGQQHEIYPDLEEILSAAEKASVLTRQLLAFSRKQTVAPKVFPVANLVTDMERMLQRLLREDVLIETSVPDEPWNVRIDPVAMEQVLINLCVNARDAMPNGGQLQVEVINETMQEMPAIGLEAGEYVRLSVTDEGTGISAEVMPRIFEPFYTTKEQGKGTGLGLSTCYGVVKQAGGYLDVHSEVGVGTTLSVYLPRVIEDADPQADPEAAQESARGTGTILVAEDNEQVRRLTTRILERRGYTVEAVSNGAEALQLLAQSTHPFDLILTDVIMPVMGGRELAQQARVLHPDLKIAFMSGFAEDELVSNGEVLDGESLLTKPFTPPELIEHVRRAMGVHEATLRSA